MSNLILYRPRVTLLTRQQFIYPAHIDWQSDSDRDGEVLTEFAGRLCYLSFGDGEIDGHRTQAGRTNNEEYLLNIIKTGHGSVTEHAVFSFLIEGVSRSLSHELVRHRAGFGFSQLSQRYVDEEGVAFVLPPDIPVGSEAYKVWIDQMMQATAAYKALTDELELTVPHRDAKGNEIPKRDRRKRVRQTARSVLPNSTETKLVVTANVRAWRHFVTLRAHPAADLEIRRLAVEVFRILEDEAPNLFQEIDETRLDDGTAAVTSGYPKV